MSKYTYKKLKTAFPKEDWQNHLFDFAGPLVGAPGIGTVRWMKNNVDKKVNIVYIIYTQ